MKRVVPSSVSFALPTSALSIDTYPEDENNEVVHPDVVDAGVQGWNGYRYWMVCTPFPASNTSFENPCIYASNDKTTWIAPGTNPIDTPSSGYNSDTDLVLKDGTLYCFYRNYAYAGSVSALLYRTSTDGVSWSPETLSFQADLHVEDILSPAILNVGNVWVMWYYDGNGHVKRRTSSTLLSWSDATTCVTPTATFWHINVSLTPYGEYVMFFSGNSGGSAMGMLTSRDGVTWDTIRTVMPSTTAAVAIKNSYRASGVFGEASLDLWSSSKGSLWLIGYTSSAVSYADDGLDAAPAPTAPGAAVYGIAFVNGQPRFVQVRPN